MATFNVPDTVVNGVKNGVKAVGNLLVGLLIVGLIALVFVGASRVYHDLHTPAPAPAPPAPPAPAPPTPKPFPSN